MVPAFNEERNIGRLLGELAALDPDLEVVVVSDGSTDRTAEVAAAAGAHVVSLPFNLGIGGAVQTGFRYAWEGGYQLAVRLDGDGQHDPAQLRAVVAPVVAGEADLAIGSRFLEGAAIARRLRAASASGCWRGSSRDRPPAAHRHHLRLSGAQPPGDPALRRRPAARLPGGRGPRDGDPAQAPGAGGAGDDAGARARPLLDRDRSPPSTT